MYWGSGPALGLLTFLGYFLLGTGALQVWRNRDDFSVWFQDEIYVLRRSFSRYRPVGPFYMLREESRFNALPTSFIRNLTLLPPRPFNGAAVLLAFRALLFLLHLL